MNQADLHFDVVIVGLGKTGLSCVRYLLKQNLTIAVMDSRDQPSGLETLQTEYDTVPIYLSGLKKEILLAAGQLILSPGVPLDNTAIKQAMAAGIPMCGDIELFCLQAKAPIIAISGSNGKSTVTTLVAEMTKRAGIKTKVGGNLGTPALELLAGETPELYVLELSSFQLDTTFSLNAHASVVLNISPDHLDRYARFDDYIEAKKKIYAGNGLMVLNQDDAVVKTMADDTRATCFFSLNKPEGKNFGVIKDADDFYLCQGGEKIISQRDLKIQGRHNIANALAAMALASSVNVPIKAMVAALKEFAGLPHRCQWVATFDNVRWYNDSKATNVAACIASIKGLCDFGKIILIAGGDSKGADLSSLAPVINREVKKVILLGADANKLASIISPDVGYELVENMAAAVSLASQIAKSGDLVLLAPACASQDLFQNYQHRGEVFVAAVKALEAC